jgi:DNA-binding PadR family transcriptional regulator
MGERVYELLILALLLRRPRHGYRIARIINEQIGPYAKLSSGRLYPLLKRMESDGLIEPVTPTTTEPRSDREARAFAITERGCRRFVELMLDTSSNPGDYQRLFWHKSNYLDLLEPAQRLELLEHYIIYCQTNLFHLKTVEKRLRDQVYELSADEQQLRGQAIVPPVMSPQHRHAVLDGLGHRTDLWKLELARAQRLCQEEVAHQKADSVRR